MRNNEGYQVEIGIGAEKAILEFEEGRPVQLASKTYDAKDISAVQELYHSSGWTDGLPIVPPTPARVARMLAGMASINYLKAGGKAVEGTIFPAESVATGVNDLAKAFIQNYTKRYGVAPDSWAMLGYSMVLIAGNAIKAAGPNPTREKVREAMLATKNLPVVVGKGAWSIDPKTRVPSFGYAVMETRANGAVEAK